MILFFFGLWGARRVLRVRMSLFELQYTSLCLESSGVQKRGTKVEGLSMRSGRIKAGLEVEKRGKSELTLTFYFFFVGMPLLF